MTRSVRRGIGRFVTDAAPSSSEIGQLLSMVEQIIDGQRLIIEALDRRFDLRPRPPMHEGRFDLRFIHLEAAAREVITSVRALTADAAVVETDAIEAARADIALLRISVQNLAVDVRDGSQADRFRIERLEHRVDELERTAREPSEL
jgi:hypothetical protein